VIFIGGAFLILGTIFWYVGMDAFVAVAVSHNKFRTLIPEFDITKITTAWLVLETIFQTIRIYGTQQDVAQRYMTTADTAKAKRSVWVGILAYIPLGFLFYFIGTALFVFYQLNPHVNLPAKGDQVLPFFVMQRMPAGLAGLVIAAIFAAAMSSIDSAMNSASTVCIEDFWKRFGRVSRTDEEYLRIARRLTLFWGVFGIAAGLLFMQIHYAQIVWGQLMAITTNGILGLLALALLPRRIHIWAAMAGFVVSYFALFTAMAVGVNYLLWPVLGNLVCFFVALFLDPLLTARGAGAEAVTHDASSLRRPPA